MISPVERWEANIVDLSAARLQGSDDLLQRGLTSGSAGMSVS
jgi:hypothetical protein